MLNVNFIKAVDSLNLKYPVAQMSSDLGVSKGTVSSYYNGNGRLFNGQQAYRTWCN